MLTPRERSRRRDFAGKTARAGLRPLLPSASIIRIDGDVVVREIAGPHSGLAGAQAQVDANRDLAALHVSGDHFLIVVRGTIAILGHLHATVGDAEPIAIGRFPALADRHPD